ncbi:MAG: cob(I)yrinic acid a,c-diamide adenosyltransferase [Candidatus Levybacteria bacterium]|nr:cob(I)yrinic acid a,c-diamide adenosyltransferase [Candidatus Levybacteria bacterium]
MYEKGLEQGFFCVLLEREGFFMPIYTRTGDKGRTALFNGQRVSKVDLRVEVYGTVDELNSIIGVVLSIRYQVLSIKRELIKIQNDLLSIGSALANPQGDALQSLEKRVKTFEEFIDEMTLHLPKLNNFILPGGGKAGAMLHLVRAVARRLERKIVELNNKQKIDNKIIIYFNRLSDLLFTMARFTNFKENKKEIIWPV